MNSGSLLLVDDDKSTLDALADALRALGYRTETATTCQEGCRRLAEYPFDVVFCDLHLPDAEGFQLLAHAREHNPATAVVLMTGFGTIASAVEGIRQGAFDYVTKPVDGDDLAACVRRVMSQRPATSEPQDLRARLDQRFGVGGIIGRDYKMVKMFDLIESVADTRTTVLILGESGTGKTMTARAIHQLSSRSHKPFVEVACGALTDTLLESELFGHVAGSFTGAVHDKVGKFLQADGGTIFLDEIATASPSLQVKLLRVLQDREFEAVGGSKTHKVDIRLILATNGNLEEMVAKGQFRKDLYYRINVITLMQPALRERPGDIPLLAQHYLEGFRQQTEKNVTGFTAEAMEALQHYPWPGNVRELINVVERAVVLTKRSVIGIEELGDTVRRDVTIPEALQSRIGGGRLKVALANPERQIILD
ncbi:MAG: sigma-54-dependent Fis family transcriptional regulator, partial [Planctomycetes bacterium]|nr:sigma-54-dependent Fis family transcriptional regulator [Planctomycetota bacterium]